MQSALGADRSRSHEVGNGTFHHCRLDPRREKFVKRKPRNSVVNAGIFLYPSRVRFVARLVKSRNLRALGFT